MHSSPCHSFSVNVVIEVLTFVVPEKEKKRKQNHFTKLEVGHSVVQPFEERYLSSVLDHMDISCVGVAFLSI